MEETDSTVFPGSVGFVPKCLNGYSPSEGFYSSIFFENVGVDGVAGAISGHGLWGLGVILDLLCALNALTICAKLTIMQKRPRMPERLSR